MAHQYGPWATLIDAGGNPQLSTFWKRRLAMLPAIHRSSVHLHRRAVLFLLLGAVFVWTLPTLRGNAGERPAATEESKGTRTAEPPAGNTKLTQSSESQKVALGETEEHAIDAIERLGFNVTRNASTISVRRRGDTPLKRSLQWHITDDSLAHLKRLRNVRALDLTGTAITDAGLSHLRGLVNLEDLVLRQTQVGDEGMAALKGLPSLKSLWLSHTMITDVGLTRLEGLKNLEVLGLEDTGVSDSGLASLKSFSKLRSLWVSGPKVTGEALGHLKGIETLQTLALRGPKVGDAGLVHVRELKKLRRCQTISYRN